MAWYDEALSAVADLAVEAIGKGRYKKVVDDRQTQASEALDPAYAEQVRTSPSPAEAAGGSGISVYGGWVTPVERQADLVGVRRYVTYNSMVRNVDSVAVGVRALLMLIGAVYWDCDPPVKNMPRPQPMRDPGTNPVRPGRGTKPAAAKTPRQEVIDKYASLGIEPNMELVNRLFPKAPGEADRKPATPAEPVAGGGPYREAEVDPAQQAAEEKAEWLEQVLFRDMQSPWASLVRRLGMFKFHGFTAHEWTAVRREDGTIGIADIENRPQVTIERWDVDRSGTLQGVEQHLPQDGEDVYIPRWKLVYVVDDELSDGDPAGVGLFRHVVEKVRQLQRLEQLEGIGYETDLRGIPYVRAPLAALEEALKDQKISPAEYNAALAPSQAFMVGHVKNDKLAVMHDSSVYRSIDDSGTPSNAPLWDMKLLTSDGQSHEAVRKAIDGKQREVARVMFAEGFLLGGDGGSNRALGEEKSRFLTDFANSVLTDIANEINDLGKRLWRLNGFAEEERPTVRFEAVSIENITIVADMLEKVSKAGAKLDPRDPVINTLRARGRLPQVPAWLSDQAAQQADAMAAAEVESARAGVAATEAGTMATIEGTRQADDKMKLDAERVKQPPEKPAPRPRK